MKSNELFEQIHSGRIKEGTKIKVINELTGDILTVIKYKEGMLKWKTGEFDTSFLCNIDIEFVIEENKEIKELPNRLLTGEDWTTFIIEHHNKINEIIREIKKTNKQLEELETSEIGEEEINDAIKRARNYLEREEK